MKDRPQGLRPRRLLNSHRRALAVLVPLLVLALVLAGAAPVPGAGASVPEPTAAARPGNEPLRPIPPPRPLDARKVALGARLFGEPLLSADGSVSCASCHRLAQGGADDQARSIGVGGAVGTINAPTVLNAALNFRQFWDGRADTLEAQIDGPLQSPLEMGSNWDAVLAKLRGSKTYAAEMQRIYAGGVTPANVRDAIAEFERSLITPDSRFDRHLRGESGALSEAELRGYGKFKTYGCVSCHQGVNVGGNMFQRMGVMGDYFADRGQITAADYGRYNVTGDEADRYSFKVPGLRNVERTAPYFHDGSAATLEQAVSVMARYQLGRELSAADVGDIVQFLKTLSADLAGSRR